MKKRKHDVLVLLIYSVPYVFLGMLGDLVCHSLLPYVLVVAAIMALLCYCMKTDRMVVAILGNLLSVLSSGLFTRGFATENWSFYFKAYSPVVRNLQFSAIVLVLQAVICWIVNSYKKETKEDAS